VCSCAGVRACASACECACECACNVPIIDILLVSALCVYEF